MTAPLPPRHFKRFLYVFNQALFSVREHSVWSCRRWNSLFENSNKWFRAHSSGGAPNWSKTQTNYKREVKNIEQQMIKEWRNLLCWLRWEQMCRALRPCCGFNNNCGNNIDLIGVRMMKYKRRVLLERAPCGS